MNPEDRQAFDHVENILILWPSFRAAAASRAPNTMHVLYDHRPGPYRLPYTQGTLYAISADAGAPGCLACARAADLGDGGREGAVVLEHLRTDVSSF